MAMLARLFLAASMAIPLLGQTNSEQIAQRAKAAQEAERRNDFATAIKQYEALVSLLPESAEVRSNLGVALYFDHQLTRAIALFQKAIALNPNLLSPHLFSGLALYRLSNPDAAVPELEKTVQLSPSDALAHTWLGYAYAAQFRYEAAVTELETASQLDPDNVDIWYALGQSHLQIGREATVQLLETAPDGGRTWQLAGEQMLLQRDRKRALDDFEGALERRPDLEELRKVVISMGGVPPASVKAQDEATNRSEDDLYEKAHEAEEQSRRAFERVAQIAPESYRAHQTLGDSFVVQQRQEDAIEEFRAVLKQKPDLPGIHESIGRVLVQIGKLPEALKEFESEIQLQPRSASAHMNAGRVLLMMGRNTEAESMLAKALQMDRPPTVTYFYLGMLDVERRNYLKAIKLLNQYVATAKNDSNAYYLLLHAYRAVGDKTKMAEAYDLYKKTSQDAKARSRAQKELEALSQRADAPEESKDVSNSF
jgi:tetratricopeptide (TPR) repeat protein